MLISWYMGDNTLNASLPAGAVPPAGQTSAAGFAPPGVTFTASIQLQTFSPGSNVGVNTTFVPTIGSTMSCLQYWRNYSAAVGWSYLSPYICHAVVTGLPAGGTVNYWISASTTIASTVTNYVTSATQMSAPGAVRPCLCATLAFTPTP